MGILQRIKQTETASKPKNKQQHVFAGTMGEIKGVGIRGKCLHHENPHLLFLAFDLSDDAKETHLGGAAQEMSQEARKIKREAERVLNSSMQ